MPKLDTTMSKFGTSYDINAINNLALKAGLKPLTPEQVKSMTPKELKSYLKTASKELAMNRRQVRGLSRQFRRNAKLTTSENYKQAQLMHGTIRQAIGEAGTLGAQAIAQNAITRDSSAKSAIEQNTDGGTVSKEDPTNTEKGPVYSKRGRKEE